MFGLLGADLAEIYYHIDSNDTIFYGGYRPI